VTSKLTQETLKNFFSTTFLMYSFQHTAPDHLTDFNSLFHPARTNKQQQQQQPTAASNLQSNYFNADINLQLLYELQ